MKLLMPYGEKGMQIELPSSAFVAKAHIPAGVPESETTNVIMKSLRNSIGFTLEELVGGTERISVLVTDKTRATPNAPILTALIDAIGQGHGITIVVSNGLHRPAGEEELRKLVGDEIYERYEVVNHNSDDEDTAYVGKTSRGTDFYLNRSVAVSDLIIGTGLIEPHFFAGYSGGRKLLLPGAASTRTVYQNHDYKKIADPRSDYGYLEGNPIHEDMVEAAKMVKTFRFIVNVLLDEQRRVIAAFSGDPYQAHVLGAKKYDSFGRVTVPFKADVTVVTNGGAPLDLNLYQAVKGMTTAARVTKRGGAIVILSRCREGIGHESFRELAAYSKNPSKILDRIRQEEPIRDQWQVQKLEQVLLKSKVVVVSEGVKEKDVEELNMIPASSFDEALEIALRLAGGDKIVAIPGGPYVIPYLANSA
ncbi:nickel-dependent lactate racemase [Tardisphaera saccharovorans]